MYACMSEHFKVGGLHICKLSAKTSEKKKKKDLALVVLLKSMVRGKISALNLHFWLIILVIFYSNVEERLNTVINFLTNKTFRDEEVRKTILLKRKLGSLNRKISQRSSGCSLSSPEDGARVAKWLRR